MSGAMIGFVVWVAVGCFFVGLGVGAMFSKKAVGFWANIETFPVKDIKRYNRATGTLFICYGVVFALLGVPLLFGSNGPYILLSVIGVLFESIAVMVIYNLVITKKYKE